MNSKFSTLFSLGNPGETESWPDYLQYGFTAEDVPDLLSVVAEKGLEDTSSKRHDSWAVVHAWRTLGQLGSRDAVEPLIELFGLLCEDELALMEIPVVMAMLGESCVAPLEPRFRDAKLSQYDRAMVAESLKEIALKYPEHKPRIIDNFIDYLREPDIVALLFNALVVAVLVDLNATESIEVVRALYERELADIRFSGDIEDVEIGFGLREQRSTPKPHLSATFRDPNSKPPEDNVAELIEYYLGLYGRDGSVLDISELDGFFTAIGCAPELIKQSRWLPAIWGSEKGAPAWRDINEAQSFTTAMMVAYNEAITSLSEDAYNALFLERMVDGKVHLVVDEWCSGFLRGYQLWQPLQEMDLMAMDEQLQPIRLFATEEGDKHRDTLNDAQIEQWQHRIEPAVGRIYRMFSQERQSVSRPVQRVAPRLGRNDPCPCGSGKKHKNCCLQ